MPAAAQDITPVSVQLMEGVAFIGEGGVELQSGVDDTAVASFWRPLQYNHQGEVLAGRMECRAAAKREPYRAALYQLEQVHAANLAQERLRGFEELDTRSAPGDVVSRLDVMGRRTSPLRYQVLTYVAVRTGSDLVSIRQSCTFLRDGRVYRQDFMRYVDRHTSFVIVLPPPASADPLTAPTLDSLVDIET
ncbi:hypothetical protein [Erythrobacter sp. EC-HK427]|uniref:hypothetical protein n=1 Tax=Erythrobacter sp. EC-HK427 TaxID=2038396 RepID=UPI00125F982E|nr:hypothetical protein [Erythrobacter sp. EC-HK427]